MEVIDPPFVAEALAWCNEIRATKGWSPLDRLPKGKRDDMLSCPCGRATGVYVGLANWGPSLSDATRFGLPPSVVVFVREFDDGRLPQYDEDPSVYDEEE